MDAQILDRDAGRHVVFAPLGLDPTERSRAALAAATETANAARAPMSGPLRLSIIPIIDPFAIPVLRAAFPNLRLFPREDTAARLVGRSNTNRLNVPLLALPRVAAARRRWRSHATRIMRTRSQGPPEPGGE